MYVKKCELKSNVCKKKNVGEKMNENEKKWM